MSGSSNRIVVPLNTNFEIFFWEVYFERLLLLRFLCFGVAVLHLRLLLLLRFLDLLRRDLRGIEYGPKNNLYVPDPSFYVSIISDNIPMDHYLELIFSL